MIRTCLKHSAATISITKLIIHLKPLLSSKHRDIATEQFLFLHSDGTNVNIWNDIWLSSHIRTMLSTHAPVQDHECVAHLFGDVPDKWNKTLILYHIHPQVAGKILFIPLPLLHRQ